MTGARIDVNDGQVLAAFAKLRERGLDSSPVLKSLGEYLLREHEKRFVAQTDPDGRPWAPLSPSYKARKRRNQDKVLSLDGSAEYRGTSRGITDHRLPAVDRDAV